MQYDIGNMVRFYPNVGTDQVFVGEVVRISQIDDSWYQYVIKYEGSNFYVSEKFIIEKVVPSVEDAENEMKARMFELVNIRLKKQLEEELAKNSALDWSFVSLKVDYFAMINQNADLELSLSDARENIKNLQSELSKYEKIRKCLLMRNLEH